MIENKKQMVSLRLGTNDLNKVRKVASRLKVRESDVFRFAIKATLGQLGMFHDETVVGRDLLPVFMEFGAEIVSYFDLDAGAVEKIINEGAPEGQKVDRRDVELVTMTGGQDSYIYLRLKKLAEGHADALGLQGVVREYMYEKYLRGEVDEGVSVQQRPMPVTEKV